MEKAVKKRYRLEAEYRKHVQAGKGRTNFNFYPETLPQADLPAPPQAAPASTQPTGIPKATSQAVAPAPKAITEARIQKYIAMTKELTGKDITKEQAIEKLKASLPKGQ